MMCGNTTEGVFLKVLASELRLDDEFLKHQPKTKKEKEFKELVEDAIKSGLKDFWRPVCDPSFDKEGNICFVSGKMPAVGWSYQWWEQKAKMYAPKHGSRLGTRYEYIAFLAVLIKKLIEYGWTEDEAWHVVCNDSEKLGHYRNSKDAKLDFEQTGSREICGWCDLGNTYKFLAVDVKVQAFWIASGNYFRNSFEYPLATLRGYGCKLRGSYYDSCGWLVFDSCPDC